MTDSPEQPNGLLAHLAKLSGANPDTEAAAFGRDILDRARWCLAHNEGHPRGVWSTSERLAVALVLDDTDHLTEMGYTVEEAQRRVADGMFYPPANLDAWFAQLRDDLNA